MKNPETEKERNRKNDISKGANQFAKYSSLAFQMGGIIFLTVWGGQKLDEVLDNQNPVFTIILSLFGVISAIYVAIKDFINMKDK
jgi:F0F1-type ATP synthase assembly protein I